MEGVVNVVNCEAAPKPPEPRLGIISEPPGREAAPRRSRQQRGDVGREAEGLKAPCRHPQQLAPPKSRLLPVLALSGREIALLASRVASAGGELDQRERSVVSVEGAVVDVCRSGVHHHSRRETSRRQIPESVLEAYQSCSQDRRPSHSQGTGLVTRFKTQYSRDGRDHRPI
eukprot:scaffold14900_cov59-Phaeocystis_antarctica.AAC.5